jgi:DNA/RNA endonuclease YhcR with UshA esterase domain
MKKIIYSVMMFAIAAFTLTSCEDVPAPYGFPEESGGKEVIPIGDPEGTGAQEDPYNVAAALTRVNAMADGETTEEIYVKGIISTISEVSVENGNATYFISDDGTTAHELQVYRGRYLGGAKFTEEGQIKVGDEVIVKGKCKNFKGNTPEFDTGSEIYMLNGVMAEVVPMDDPKGTGVQNDPYNVAAALNLITPMADGQLTDEIYVKGIISKIQEVSVQNGNATYFISDDGTEDNQLEVYRGKYLNGADFTSASQIKVGDVVIVKGKCKNFKGNTPEFDFGNVLYSLNGQTEGGDTPGQDGNITKTVDGSVITITDNSVTATAGVVDMIDLSLQDALGWEDKQAENLVVNTNMGTVSFEKGEGRNAPAYYPPVVRMYAKNYFTAGGGNMKVAKIVITCDGSYTGNQTLYAEADGTLMTVYNEHSSNSGGTQLRIKTIEIYYGE